MKVVMISEEKLDELRDSCLEKLKLEKCKTTEFTPELKYFADELQGRMHYYIHKLVDAIKKE